MAKYTSKFTGIEIDERLSKVSEEFTSEEKRKLSALENYDDNGITKSIEDLEENKANKSEVYNREETDAKITAKVAEIISDAPEEFDTLKEMSDWLTEHSDNAATMNTAIQENTKAIADNVMAIEKNAADIEANMADIEQNKSNISSTENAIAINRATLGAQKKNLFNFEKFLIEREATFTKEGSEYTVTTNSALNTQKYYFAEENTRIIISGILTNITSSNARISLIDANGNVVNAYAIDATHTSAVSIAAGLKFDWSSTGRFKINELMIRSADIADDTYEPYKPSLQEQINTNETDISSAKNSIAINKTTLGTQCKNLLNHTAKTETVNGVNITVNTDGSITFAGTFNGTSAYYHQIYKNADGSNKTIKKGKYIVSGGAENFSLFVKHGTNINSDSTSTQYGVKTSDQPITIKNETEFIGFFVSLSPAKEYNATIYPMLRSADITDSTYEPYVPTVNERLVEAESDIDILDERFTANEEQTNTNTNDIAINRTTLGTQCKNLLSVNDGTATRFIDKIINPIEPGKYIVSIGELTSTDVDSSICLCLFTDNNNTPLSNNIHLKRGTNVSAIATINESVTKIRIYASNDWNNSDGDKVTASNIMLRPVDITDSTYEPYKPSLQKQINANKTDISSAKNDIAVNRATLGTQCKNLVIVRPSVSGEYYGTVWTKNADESITINGTVTQNNFPIIADFTPTKIGKYILSGCPKGGGNGSYQLYIEELGYDAGSGVTLNVTELKTYRVKIATYANYAYDNLTFYPMIRPADITDSTYEPYAPSVNERLVELKQNKMGYEYGYAYAKNDTNVGWFKAARFSCPATGSTIRRATFFVSGWSASSTGLLNVAVTSVSGNTPGIGSLGCSWSYNQFTTSNGQYVTNIPTDSFKAIANLDGNMIRVELWCNIKTAYFVLKSRLLNFESRTDFLPISEVEMYSSSTATTEEPTGAVNTISSYNLRKELDNLTTRITDLETNYQIVDLLHGATSYITTISGTFTSNGPTTSETATTRIRTDVIVVKAGDVIKITNGSLYHMCGIWKDSISTANNIRNDTSTITKDEAFRIENDGYVVIAFRNKNNTTLSPSEFDGSITLYQNTTYRELTAAAQEGANSI